MSFETETENRRRSLEAKENSAEQKENAKDMAELKAAAKMERADFISKEVKQGKKQMQNIMVHMQGVLTAIRQLRTQLQLVQNDDDISSVSHDKKKIEDLTKKIKEYGTELINMRNDLVKEQIEDLKNSGFNLNFGDLQNEAERLVDQMIAEVNS